MTETPTPPCDLTSAHCIDCHYALRGSQTDRCPECGRPFDRADAETMNFGRHRPPWVRALATPTGSWVRMPTLIGCAAILWGAAWLAGAQRVEMLGWSLMIATSSYRLVRHVIRALIRRAFAQPHTRHPPLRFKRWQLALLALAMSSRFFFWPLYLNLLIHRPLLDRFARYAFEDVPMLNPPPTPRSIGLLTVNRVVTSPSGVSLAISGGGTLHWWASTPWSYPSWPAPGDVPWYLKWVLAPATGRWVVHMPRDLIAD